MNPVTIGKATLHNCDCMELLKATPDKFYDLAIVDPPYGIGIANTEQIGTGTKHKIKDWDKNTPSQEYFDELKRISKKQIIWGFNYFDGFGLKGGAIIWNKLGTHIGTRKNPPTFSECEIAFYSGATNVKMFSYTYIGNVQGNFYQVKWTGTDRIHPTQKPIELYEWLLTNYAKQGDKILDTHLGSGSHAIACNNLGFELTACELDKDYFDASVKRITAANKQIRMFD